MTEKKEYSPEVEASVERDDAPKGDPDRLAGGISRDLINVVEGKIDTPEEFPCYILTLRGNEMAPIMPALARAFREMFNNEFGQFAFYPSDGQPISVQEAFKVGPNDFVDLERMDAFDLEALRRADTGEIPMFWHDPVTTENILGDKLLKAGYGSFLIGKENQKILGAIFARVCSLQEEYETEEWRNPVLYSGYEDHSWFRDIESLLNALNSVIIHHPELQVHLDESNGLFEPETEVFAWNNMFLHPSIRRSKQLLQMTGAFFDMVEHLKDNTLIVGETAYGTHAYDIFTNSGLKDVLGFLKQGELQKGDLLLKTGLLRPIADAFSLSHEEFRELGKKTKVFKN